MYNEVIYSLIIGSRLIIYNILVVWLYIINKYEIDN